MNRRKVALAESNRNRANIAEKINGIFFITAILMDIATPPYMEIEYNIEEKIEKA